MCATLETCPKHGDAPPASPAAVFYLQLFSRVQRWKALPMEGGLLDQEEMLLRRLDLISDLVEEHEARERKLAAMRKNVSDFMTQQQRGAAPVPGGIVWSG